MRQAQGLAYRACPPHPPQTSNLVSTRELVRNADSQAPPSSSRRGRGVLTRSQVKPPPSGSGYRNRAQLPPLPLQHPRAEATTPGLGSGGQGSEIMTGQVRGEKPSGFSQHPNE